MILAAVAYLFIHVYGLNNWHKFLFWKFNRFDQNNELKMFLLSGYIRRHNTQYNDNSP